MTGRSGSALSRNKNSSAWIKNVCKKEQEDNAALLASQAQQAPVMFGSHTPCYDEHGQELDYHDDVPIADSQASMTWSDYFCQHHGEDGKRIAE